MTATRMDIIHTFLDAPAPPSHERWDVDEDTYINNVMLTLDRDYEMGYLLEIVERSSSAVSYLVVVTFPGLTAGLWDHQTHDSEWYPGDVGTFFDRRVSSLDAQLWAVSKIHGLLDASRDRRRASLK